MIWSVENAEKRMKSEWRCKHMAEHSSMDVHLCNIIQFWGVSVTSTVSETTYSSGTLITQLGEPRDCLKFEKQLRVDIRLKVIDVINILIFWNSNGGFICVCAVVIKCISSTILELWPLEIHASPIWRFQCHQSNNARQNLHLGITFIFRLCFLNKLDVNLGVVGLSFSWQSPHCGGHIIVANVQYCEWSRFVSIRTQSGHWRRILFDIANAHTIMRLNLGNESSQSKIRNIFTFLRIRTECGSRNRLQMGWRVERIQEALM